VVTGILALIFLRRLYVAKTAPVQSANLEAEPM
jgi:hypothetical protein